jgi:hypothetical protein
MRAGGSPAKRAVVVPAIFAGAAAGGAIALGVGWALPFARHLGAKAESIATPRPLELQRDEQRLELAALRQQVEQLKQQAASAPPAAAAPANVPAPASPPFDPVAAQLLQQAKFERALQAHRAEPIDPSWAPRTERSLSANFESLASLAHFRLDGINCRMTSCEADVTFNRYQDAQQNFTKILHKNYDVNCAATILIPPPDDLSGRYRSSVLLDCAQTRAQ